MSRRRRRQEQARERAKRDETRSQETAPTREAQSTRDQQWCQDGIGGSTGNPAGTSDQSLDDQRARVRVCAKLVVTDPTVRSQRWRCLTMLHEAGLWRTGETAYDLGEYWGLKGSTVESDYSSVVCALEAMGDPEKAQLLFWQALHSSLVRAERIIERAETTLDGYESTGLSPEQWMAVSNAFARFNEMHDKVIERLGKASGVLQAAGATNVEVKVLGGSVDVAPKQMREAVVILLDEIQAASPEVAIKVLTRLRERGLIPSTVDIEAPALPAGGG